MPIEADGAIDLSAVFACLDAASIGSRIESLAAAEPGRRVTACAPDLAAAVEAWRARDAGFFRSELGAGAVADGEPIPRGDPAEVDLLFVAWLYAPVGSGGERRRWCVDAESLAWMLERSGARVESVERSAGAAGCARVEARAVSGAGRS